MELKEYQSQALDAFSRWLDELRLARAAAEASEQVLQALPPEAVAAARDYPRTTWNRLRGADQLPSSAGEYVPRTDEAERPIPHICFKVPTGGGKTLLGAAALERLSQPTGLVLWFVPTRTIYAQTKAALWNREHPYRQMLERASGGRVKLLEKDDTLTRDDIAHYLCVMLISLQGANRKNNKEFLRMFRSSGRYPSFFPPDDDLWAHTNLLTEHPDLYQIDGGGMAAQSLANVFKLTRPAVVLDEAHKAYGTAKAAGAEFVQSINRYNPSLVIELSATPNRRASNVLVDIDGPALKREEMIKLPIQVRTTKDTDWKHTLALAADELAQLEHAADNFAENSGRYIRPIAVVRVERTGKDQRNTDHIHAEDARDHLQKLGVPADQIAVKSAEVDEVTGVDLMSPYSPIRWIITKAALMEGWDCSFAYLLVVLDNTQSKRAITQLVGRVMRQPEARRTEVEALDQCYVYCTETTVSEAMSHVKDGLEREGLGDLLDDVHGESTQLRLQEFQRRPEFADSKIFLPKVLHRDADSWSDLDYQRHILPHIDWDDIRIADVQSSLPRRPSIEFGTIDLDEHGVVASGWGEAELPDAEPLRVSWYARRLADLVPNPWQAARIASDMIDDLRAADQTDKQIYRQRATLVEWLRAQVRRQIEMQSERVFRGKLGAGDIRFSLDAKLPNHRITAEPFKRLLPANFHEFQPSLGRQLRLSLFTPVIEEELDSELEKRFAKYLDERKALTWWHRVGVRQSREYYLRGWKPERIWPDFIAMAGETDGRPHLLVFEIKGDHLAQTEDTQYKEHVLRTLEAAFNPGKAVNEDGGPYGAVKVRNGPMRGTFQLVFEQESFDVVERALGLI